MIFFEVPEGKLCIFIEVPVASQESERLCIFIEVPVASQGK